MELFEKEYNIGDGKSVTVRHIAVILGKELLFLWSFRVVKALPSNKPRFEGRFDPDIAEKLDEYRKARNWKRSELVKYALLLLLDNKQFHLDFDEQTLKKLAKHAKKGFRPLEDQIKMAVVEWLESQQSE